MPFVWLAVFGAVALLVRRTWKASRRRRQAPVPVEASDDAEDEDARPSTGEDGMGAAMEMED